MLSLGYAWQKRFGTLERADVKRLRQVELRVRLANEHARYRYGARKKHWSTAETRVKNIRSLACHRARLVAMKNVSRHCRTAE